MKNIKKLIILLIIKICVFSCANNQIYRSVANSPIIGSVSEKKFKEVIDYYRMILRSDRTDSKKFILIRDFINENASYFSKDQYLNLTEFIIKEISRYDHPNYHLMEQHDRALFHALLKDHLLTFEDLTDDDISQVKKLYLNNFYKEKVLDLETWIIEYVKRNNHQTRLFEQHIMESSWEVGNRRKVYYSVWFDNYAHKVMNSNRSNQEKYEIMSRVLKHKLKIRDMDRFNKISNSLIHAVLDAAMDNRISYPIVIPSYIQLLVNVFSESDIKANSNLQNLKNIFKFYAVRRVIRHPEYPNSIDLDYNQNSNLYKTFKNGLAAINKVNERGDDGDCNEAIRSFFKGL